ncbi:MAG: PAS domain S-box protein [Mariprofundales bacterium]
MTSDDLQRRYTELLIAYCAEQSETQLHQGRALGHAMVAQEVPPEIIADMHHSAMLAMRDAQPEHHCADLITFGSRMLSEMLMSYGLAFREQLSRRELEESLRLASEAVENTQDGVIITDLDGHIIRVNPAFCVVTGYSAEEVIGKTPAVLHSGRQDKAFYRAMWQAIESKGCWAGKLWNRRKNGDIYSEHLAITTTYDHHGQPVHRVGVFSDLSEQETLEEQLRQSMKMESIGTLVGGIAHDFNNMLAGLSGNIYLLGQSVDSDAMRNRLDQMDVICQRASEMITQLLTFARKGVVAMHPLPFTSFLKEAVKLARVTIPENIQFRYDITADPLTISGDATQLQQVLMNLLNNARDAVSQTKKPEITLSLTGFTADGDFCKRHPELTQDYTEFARLSLHDNGAGIPKEMLNHIFEPFFTTKDQGKGTGLGLSMVYGAIQSHHGVIEVESLCNFGTLFHLYFPTIVSENSVEDRSSCSALPKRSTTGATLLLADDDISVRTTTSEVLEDLGYCVLTASDGEEAWSLFQAQPKGSIALVILDVVMPHIDGLQLAKMIRQHDRQQKIMFATGYDKNRLFNNKDDHAISDIEVLSKPFNFDKLSVKIDAVIAQ